MNTIPKIIHYVWGYNEPKPTNVQMCIASWVTLMPDYEIKEWNESNLDYEELGRNCRFFKESLELKLWAYVADYIRFKVLYEYGGIYLDVDVQAIKRMDVFMKHGFYAGFHCGFKDNLQDNNLVEGAVMGAIPRHPFIQSMLVFFEQQMHKRNIAFLPYAINEVLDKNYGYIKAQSQALSLRDNIVLYPHRYFHPLINSKSAMDVRQIIQEDTYTVHWHRNSYSGRLDLYLYMHHRASSQGERIKAIVKYVLFKVKTFFRK